MNRRDFLSQTAVGASMFAVSGGSLLANAASADRNYQLSLKADAIGIKKTVVELLKPAAKMGWEAIALPVELLGQ